MNNGWKKFLSFFKQFGAKQTEREDDKEKFVKHFRETALKSGKPPIENQTDEHFENGDKIED